MASDSLDPLALDAGEAERRIAGRRLADLRYYNGEIHQALFVLPNFYRDLLSGRRGAGDIVQCFVGRCDVVVKIMGDA